MKGLTFAVILLGAQVAHAGQSSDHVNNFICSKYQSTAAQVLKARYRNVPKDFEMAMAGGSPITNQLVEDAYNLPTAKSKTEQAEQLNHFMTSVKFDCLANMRREQGVEPALVAQ